MYGMSAVPAQWPFHRSDERRPPHRRTCSLFIEGESCLLKKLRDEGFLGGFPCVSCHMPVSGFAVNVMWCVALPVFTVQPCKPTKKYCWKWCGCVTQGGCAFVLAGPSMSVEGRQVLEWR
jgi:hypothetical protein